MDVCSRCLPLQLRKWLSQQYPIAMTDVPWWHSKFFSKFIDNKIERGRSKFVKANPQYKDNQRVRTVVLPWLSLDWDGWLRLLLCKTCCWRPHTNVVCRQKREEKHGKPGAHVCSPGAVRL